MDQKSVDTRTPLTNLTERYSQAVSYAAVLHGAQMRKGTSIAYISHLLGVSSLVIEAGGDEDLAIAGLLHDAVEDAGGLPRLADVEARFGKRVADVVFACSDSHNEEWKASVSYWERKQQYLDHLVEASDDALIVSTADKLHNARAICVDLQESGVDVLDKFNGSRQEVLRYYSECCRIAVERGVSTKLTLPLQAAVEEIRAYVDGNI